MPRAEIAFKEIQSYSNRKKCSFFVDMTKKEFIKASRNNMFSLNGWMIPHEIENEFLKIRNGRKDSSWDLYYIKLGVFYAFEDNGQWGFREDKAEHC